MSEHIAQQDSTTHTLAPAIAPEDVTAVRAYAGAFCGKQQAAAELAAEVLSRAARQQTPVGRLALLTGVRRTADAWVHDERAGLARPGFRSWARRATGTFGPTDTLRRVEHSSLLLAAFRELAEQPQTALWLCLAEHDTATAAQALGTSEEFAASMAETAKGRLADAFLRLRAERTAEARCVHYGTMLGAMARGTHRDIPDDLRQHLDTCKLCTHDFALLRALTAGGPEELRAMLVDQILVWGGPAYRKARGARVDGRADPAPDQAAGPVRSATAPAPDPEPETAAPLPREPRRRRPVLAVAVAVVLTAAATTGILSWTGDEEPAQAASAVSPTVAASPSPAPSATADGALATVALENTGSGRCLEADAGESPDNVPEPTVCATGETQQWRVAATGKSAYALVHAASGFCLDIAGDRVQGDPMQLRPCAYRQGDDAPYPEDQAFLLSPRTDGTFTVVCQENPEIAVGVRSGEVRMLTATGSGRAIRFVLDDGLANALAN
ncbi:RICIN domain-containing protein [Streptomyces sp. NBC_00140]|uniref:RICIN domain-containing protein n=1 Tax=Streptomyces sp. NBC_00140 TaxID=2975664 RepID=UPI002254C787|nr:RICIN domain-containing protein [Streptomyces sp. NBC_00140]MCX5333886.1 RICIN domain-containing protein [Streptomyces sp. NBC_00140]